MCQGGHVFPLLLNDDIYHDAFMGQPSGVNWALVYSAIARAERAPDTDAR